jgi:hypothetical protein
MRFLDPRGPCPIGPAVNSAIMAQSSMNNYVLSIGALSLFLSGASMAQHGGTEQGAACVRRQFQRYCRDQGDFAVLGCLQQHREKPTRVL